MAKQELLDHLKEMVDTNQRLNKSIEILGKIKPYSYFEIEIKNILKEVLENQQKLNRQLNLIIGLLIKE